MIEREKAHHPVATLCRVLGVSSSGSYAWGNHEPSARAQADAVVGEQVIQIHRTSRQTYGVVRIQAALRAEGIRCGNRRIARLMRDAGLEGCHRRKRYGTTQREASRPVAPDLVSRSFQAAAPNELWVADITYVPTWDGFLYLSVVLDAYSRKVVGWCMAGHLRTELVLSALEMAVLTRRPEPGVIHHSDQGCQYTSIAFGYRCREAGIAPSMGSHGDCFDNAMAESFFATLECELLNCQRFTTKNDARMAIFDDIETFSNRERRHSALGYLAPIVYEQQMTQVAA